MKGKLVACTSRQGTRGSEGLVEGSDGKKKEKYRYIDKNLILNSISLRIIFYLNTARQAWGCYMLGNGRALQPWCVEIAVFYVAMLTLSHVSSMVQQSRLWIKALGRVGTLRVALDQLFRTAWQNGAFLTKRIRAGDNAPCHLSLSLLMFFLQIFFFNPKKVCPRVWELSFHAQDKYISYWLWRTRGWSTLRTFCTLLW